MGMQAQTKHVTDRTKLAQTPPMGWMSWNLFSSEINEDLIKEMADAMVSGGFRDAGYQYIFIDDCWQGGRDNRNNIIPDPQKFPHGIKALADYVHSKGLKLGIYSDAAPLTCAGYTASYGFEEQDAKTFAHWGIDYLKYDYCNAPSDRATAEKRYKAMADALSKSGRDITFGICEWGGRQPYIWAYQAGGQVWRTTYDIRDMWKDTLHQGGIGILDDINQNADLHAYAGPGHWNDMDMLVVGLYGKGGPSSDLGGVGCNDIEYETQMSMWCMLGSPLAMSNDLRNVNAATRRILLNKDVIAINQDPLGKVAVPKVRNDNYQVYLRPLSGDRYALAILNISDHPQHIKVALSDLGLDKKRYSFYDVWSHQQMKSGNKWGGKVLSHQTKVFILK
ncbi:MAG: glycoside hydrolase family 27 protein [Prevotella sp.]|nr:glycoside hydrolase family 27 protein [Prevotella sp.]MCI2080559.1 glycoside hydrolase family 27 protein [Prevotella sp.]MCI2102418.1 glycoside hydrolase family 27 protein [Prevotella sp.]